MHGAARLPTEQAGWWSWCGRGWERTHLELGAHASALHAPEPHVTRDLPLLGRPHIVLPTAMPARARQQMPAWLACSRQASRGRMRHACGTHAARRVRRTRFFLNFFITPSTITLRRNLRIATSTLP